MDERTSIGSQRLAEADGQQPIWQQIRANLAGEIASGQRPGGSMLPTEAALSRHFGVNRHTIRRALRALAEDGLVRAEQGRGTFVQDVGIDYLIGSRTRFSENIRAQDFEPGLELLGFRICPAPVDIAEMLDIEPETEIFETQTRRLADDRPVTVSTSYYAGIDARLFERALRKGQSVTTALAALGIDDYHRKKTIVSARMPSAADADLLKQPRARPILHVESVNVLDDGRPIEFARTRFASDRIQLVFDPEC
jgi:GntR family phosphonate transport system transcriptional regulator